MALTKGEVDAALRLRDEAQRVLDSNHDVILAAQDAAERMRDIIDPPAYGHFREMEERLKDLVDPPYVRQLREIVDSTHVKTLADMCAGIKPAIDSEMLGGTLTSRLFAECEVIEPVDHFAGLKALMPAESLSAAIARSWPADVDSVGSIARTADLFRSSSLSDYAKDSAALTRISAETEKLLASLDVGRGFADLLRVTDVTRSLVEYETDRLSRAYAGFRASIVARPEWLASAPETIRIVPGEIVFAQARFVRTVTTHEDVEEQSAADEIWDGVKDRTLGYIGTVLPELSPRLMKSWEGVWDAARRRGADWARQAGASLRFILIETLDTVAPVDSLSDIPKEYVRDGKFGRPAQVYWLCVPLNNRTYRRVSRADLESAISIIDAMSEAVHRDDYVEIEDAFDTMAVRASVALANLLKLWKARN
jgi:hypothetical protein